jgi:uncharacterized protein
MTVKSPCKNICKINKNSIFCVGCYRNEYEIFNWIYFSEDEKKIILAKIRKRNIPINKIKNNLLKKY